MDIFGQFQKSSNGSHKVSFTLLVILDILGECNFRILASLSIPVPISNRSIAVHTFRRKNTAMEGTLRSNMQREASVGWILSN